MKGHSHPCPKCGNRWAYNGCFSIPALTPEDEFSVTCPVCDPSHYLAKEGNWSYADDFKQWVTEVRDASLPEV